MEENGGKRRKRGTREEYMFRFSSMCMSFDIFDMTGKIRELKSAKHSSASVLMTQLDVFMINMLKPFH